MHSQVLASPCSRCACFGAVWLVELYRQGLKATAHSTINTVCNLCIVQVNTYTPNSGEGLKRLDYRVG